MKKIKSMKFSIIDSIRPKKTKIYVNLSIQNIHFWLLPLFICEQIKNYPNTLNILEN